MADPIPLTVPAPDGPELAAELDLGGGRTPPILALHGLTATRRYVLQGSRVVQSAGHAVVAYDARGHGESTPAAGPDDYAYPHLVADAVRVLDASEMERTAVVGQSMGAATAVGLALAHPERVAALVLVTPAHLGRPSDDLARWDALAAGYAAGGPEGFLAAYGPPRVPERWRATVETVILQRLGRHRHPRGVVDALRGTPRSAAFDGMEALRGIRAPTLVVASRDEADPEHPLRVAEAWAGRIAGARLVVEAEGETPLAWRGGTLSRAIVEFLAEVAA